VHPHVHPPQPAFNPSDFSDLRHLVILFELKFYKMKPTPTNRKLQLNKQAVSNLSREQMYVIVAGKEEERLTTSIFGCPVGSCATCCAAEVAVAVTSPASLSTIIQTTTLV
jgi:hypothetical protein